MIVLPTFNNGTQPTTQYVVRLTTSYWRDRRGIHMKKSLVCLRRKSNGYEILEEDAANGGVEHVFPRIVNLDACEDGVYEVCICNEHRDWKSGHIDDYDYRLLALPVEPIAE